MWVVPTLQALATITIIKPINWDGAKAGLLGISGITFSISGVDLTFTCLEAYPKIPIGVTMPKCVNSCLRI